MPADEHAVSAAVLLVARKAIADTLAAHPPQWEDFPDIGERDWQRVDAEVDRIADQFAGQTELYGVAYRLLTDRAGEVPGE